jgi:ssDNA-binding Zn-finger/Zn-ribbon topoisomerase 1
MCWMNIVCPKCGEESSLEAMTERTVAGVLPMDHFQCPKCGCAFARKMVEPPQPYTYQGEVHYLPGKMALVPGEALL